MSKLICCMAFLGGLYAEDLVGTWRGAVTPNGRELRSGILIARAIPSTSVTLEGSDLHEPRREFDCGRCEARDQFANCDLFTDVFAIDRAERASEN